MSIGIGLRGAVASIVLLGMPFWSPGGAAAHNWGAGTSNENWACLAIGDRNPDEWKSECTTQDQYWYVYVFAGVPDWFRNKVEASVTEDYSLPSSGFYSYWQTQINVSTDVHARDLQVPDAWTYGVYTTCENHLDVGGGDGYYRWCDEQVIVIDETHRWTKTINTTQERNWLACHELGHTTGLQHPAGSGRDTCMDYDNDDFLDDHDRQHLADCYPRPNPPPYNLTTACYEYQ